MIDLDPPTAILLAMNLGAVVMVLAFRHLQEEEERWKAESKVRHQHAGQPIGAVNPYPPRPMPMMVPAPPDRCRYCGRYRLVNESSCLGCGAPLLPRKTPSPAIPPPGPSSPIIRSQRHRQPDDVCTEWAELRGDDVIARFCTRWDRPSLIDSRNIIRIEGVH